MKRSGDEQSENVPYKAFILSRESLEELDKEALIEKLISLEDQLRESKDEAQRAKRRETLTRLQVIRRNKEINDLKSERSNAYYVNGNQRDQLLDPYFYEAFIAMKEKLATKNKTVADQVGKIKVLKCSEDVSALCKTVHEGLAAREKLREYDRNSHLKIFLNKRIKLAYIAFQAVLKEKKDLSDEITKKDAKIAKLYKEIYQLRSELSEDVVFEQMDEDEDAKPVVASSSAETVNTAVQSGMKDGEDDDVIILENESASTSQAHNESNKEGGNTVDGESSGSEERCVSVDQSGRLKITV